MDRALAFQEMMNKLSAKKPTAPPVFKVEPAKPGAEKKVEKGIDWEKLKTKDHPLWESWKAGGMKPKDLEPLLQHFKGRIEQAARRNYSSEIPRESVYFEHEKAAIDAFKSFDPTRGAALDTHVTNRLAQKPRRFMIQNRNVARIRDERLVERIMDFNRLKSDLAEQKGFEPDAHSIHDYLLKQDHPYEKLRGLSLKDINRLNTEQRKSHIKTGLGLDSATANSYSSRDREVILSIIPHLTDEERKVHELTFGLNGSPTLKPGEIAKKLKFSGPKVSNLKKAILTKMSPYLEDA
jgi:DNA-directed RNA polymerase sigma subunit (sigma70/sigma32)